MLARVPREAPVTVHLQLTTVCNLACKGCWYREKPVTMPRDKALRLVEEWADAGVKSIAIGGGEPMLVEYLNDVVYLAKLRGLWVAVTTNGTVCRTDVVPDRVAISWDRLHERTWNDGVAVALNGYRNRGIEVGINHVLSSWDAFKRVHDWMAMEELLKHKDGLPALTLILNKPYSFFDAWGELAMLPRGEFAMDACLARKIYGVECKQGLTSMYVSAGGLASVCSNVRERRTYVGLKETFAALPKACLYEMVEVA